MAKPNTKFNVIIFFLTAAAETDTKSNTVEMYSHVDDITREDLSDGSAPYSDRAATGSRGVYLDDATLEHANLYQGTSPTYKTFREAYSSRGTDLDSADYTEALRRQQYGFSRGTPDPYTTYSKLQTSPTGVSARSPVMQGIILFVLYSVFTK